MWFWPFCHIGIFGQKEFRSLKFGPEQLIEDVGELFGRKHPKLAHCIVKMVMAMAGFDLQI